VWAGLESGDPVIADIARDPRLRPTATPGQAGQVGKGKNLTAD